MQYGTAHCGAARSRAVSRLWLIFLGLMLCGCKGAVTPRARPAGPAPSSELRRFAFEPGDNPQLSAAAVAGISARALQVELPFGSTVTALVPRIEHAGVSVSPDSGVEQDFTQPVDYTVTASDGSESVYTVTVKILSEAGQPLDAGALAPALFDSTKEITRFSIAGVAATIAGAKIELTVPHDTRLLNITPELVFEGAAILPSPLDPQDFRGIVRYTVMAQDGSTREYSVHVTVAPNESNAITHFRVFDTESTITGNQIALVLPAGTDITMLEPQIILSGGTVMPPSGQQQDFSQPVQYTTTARDGSTETYTVMVSLAAGNTNEILSFEVPSVYTSLRGDEISLYAPFGTSDCTYAPAVTHAGASIEPPVGEAQDFLRGAVYTVTAADGTARSYTAICQIAETSARGLASFEVLGLPATIVGSDITLTVPSAASLGALTPTIVHHGVRVSPASGVSQSFYGPVTYTLVEATGETSEYTVRIVNAERSDNTLVDFVYAGRHARIDGDKVELTLPAGSDLSALTPMVLHRGARVIPSGTPRNFATPQVYGVIARDSTRRDYEVTIRVAAPSDKELTAFVLAPTAASITGNEVALVLPAGTDLRALKPSLLQHTGKSISPSADEPQDFSKPVSYVVTAADDSKQSYEVRASTLPE